MISKRNLAIVIVGAVAVTGVGSYFAYKASVKEQICRSYEDQVKKDLEDRTNHARRWSSINTESVSVVQAERILESMNVLNRELVDMDIRFNNLKYAYDKTCGEKRRISFLQTSEMREKVQNLNNWTRNAANR